MTATKRIIIAGISGVGRVLAQRLLVRGTAVHLVARSADKLSALRAELSLISPTTSTLISTSVADAMNDSDAWFYVQISQPLLNNLGE
jgi:short-subunit dehydrogenase